MEDSSNVLQRNQKVKDGVGVFLQENRRGMDAEGRLQAAVSLHHAAAVRLRALRNLRTELPV